ncbi:MAG: c-type cytochrome [Bacteriovoracia bacterium]
MKDWMKPIIIFILCVSLAGLVMMVSGLINISASSGHFKVTALILEFAKRRYASTYSLTVKRPKLTDEDMILRGAGHYEIGCRQCHGIPGEVNLLGLKTTPESPYLPPTIKKYEPEELFRIVKYGLKFTGMPSWPSLKRDDEVWSMVSFLLKLPEMSESEYKKLVYGKHGPFILPPPPYTDEILSDTLMTCAHCHGMDGNGRGKGVFPKLSGQNKDYIEGSLHAYKRGERHSGTMELIAVSLSKEMIKSVAEYYSSQRRIKSLPPSIDSRRKAILRGKAIAFKGVPEKKVAACIGCHGPDPEGKTRKPHFPDLRGQPWSYLSNQLRLFIEDKRGGSEHASLMKKAVPDLTEKEREDVSLYYESLSHPAIQNHAAEINEYN